MYVVLHGESIVAIVGAVIELMSNGKGRATPLSQLASNKTVNSFEMECYMRGFLGCLPYSKYCCEHD